MATDRTDHGPRTGGRERFIPFRRGDIVRMLLEKTDLPEEDRRELPALSEMLASVFHYEGLPTLRALKDAYAPFDPDRDTRAIAEPTEEEKERASDRLVAGLREVLAKANYEPVPRAAIEHALSRHSLFRIRLHIRFEDFDELLLFRRGERVTTETLVSLFGLRKREIEVPIWERIVVYVRFQSEEWFRARGRKRLAFTPGTTILKLFGSIPRDDIEMLLPNSEVRMRLVDKLFVGVPAVVGAVVVMATKAAAVVGFVAALILFTLGMAERRPAMDSAHLVAVGAGLAALIGYLVKQWMNVKNRRIRFMKSLTENLYFKNLDNNAGVIQTLVDAAESEDLKECLLAYAFLRAAARPIPVADLDRRIESWFEKEWGVRLDFEVEDGVAKLERLRLLERGPAGLTVVPPAEARRRLDETWDGYFDGSAGPAE